VISVEEAQDIILKEIKILGDERVLLPDALGRSLSSQIISPINHPPWDNSAMDGYAVRYADTQNASKANPVCLKVVEEIPAGILPQYTVRPGEASKIMTGAPMPSGADAVIMVEDTNGSKKSVEIYEAPELGEYIRRKGEAIEAGTVVLEKGKFVRSAEIALLASIGKSIVPVYQKPRVAVLATGDELADLDEVLGDDKIANSNGYGLAAQVVEAGGLAINLGIAKDNKSDLRQKIESGLSADFLLISGGVSMGDYDFVIEVLESLGVTMRFWRVAMKPGKPLAFGIKNGRPIFGLPGNPVSSMVTFEQFVRPAILKASGRSKYLRPLISAMLEEDIRKQADRRQFLRAFVSVKDGIFRVRSTGHQGSGILMSLVKANALLIVPEGEELVKSGETVSVQLLSEVAIQLA